MPELIKENQKISEGPYTGPPRVLVLGVATAAGAGYAPVAPGSLGSAVGVLLYIALWGLHPALFAVTAAGLLALGIWAAEYAEHAFGQHDDGRIVIDEVAGQLVTLAPVFVYGEGAEARGAFAWWGLVVTGFVVFRVLDIWKPGPVRWAEQRFEGGLGVMADDLLAGVIGGLLLTVSCIVLAVTESS